MSNASAADIRVALLTNFIGPYRIPLFQELSRRVKALRVFVSVLMEANRHWDANFGQLDVVVHRNLTRKRIWRHPSGFEEVTYTHFPYDTIWQLLRYRPDVVISGEFGFRTLCAAVYTVLTRSKLIIWATVSESSEANREGARLFLRAIFLRLTSAVITNGTSGKRYLVAHGARPEKVFIAPQTIDCEVFAAVPLVRDPGSCRSLIYVGSLIPRKGIRPFLSCLARWCEQHPDQKVELQISGEGEERAKIEVYSCPGNLSVRLMGNASYSEMPGRYASAEVMVLPTFADEWGLVVSEALASGLPVLGSIYSSAVEDLVEEGSNGWLFRVDHAEEMYGAIDRCLTTSREQLRDMGARARAVSMRITPGYVTDRIMEAIRYATERAK